MHKYTVEFRISGRDLNPPEISKELNVEPCQVRVCGAPGSRFEKALWAYDGILEGSMVTKEWSSLEEGFLHILSILVPKRDLIRTYLNRFDAFWWCGHFQEGFNGGPAFSADLLRRLADFGAPIFIDNYFSASQVLREQRYKA